MIVKDLKIYLRRRRLAEACLVKRRLARPRFALILIRLGGRDVFDSVWGGASPWCRG